LVSRKDRCPTSKWSTKLKGCLIAPNNSLRASLHHTNSNKNTHQAIA
jgi:hypothetical protein